MTILRKRRLLGQQERGRKDRKCIPSIVADLKAQDTMSAAPSAPLNDEEDDSESDPDEMDDAGEL
ncbi:hypothetical protein E2562_032326 [Oryza meyeriana var. granulata]|uniref:Uncharacterized protein n=1 Tax=Oryza meyeriana var. granulata TaxID=110450 RepID=A0A6G1E5T6_9ORYZ|nr:hypothetical protein E2562_032326 [Oryza meyeriana var. granulata]